MENFQSIFGYLVLILILIGIIAFCVFMIIKISKARKKAKQELKAKGVTVSAMLPHVSGLPIAENSICTLLLYSDKIEINANGAQFNLQKDKITDASLQRDVDIQKQYTSSAGGAVAGALLFGPAGALIAGRAKKKKVKDVHYYLIFTYKKEDSLEYIAFDATASYLAASKFINDFKKDPQKEVHQIEL